MAGTPPAPPRGTLSLSAMKEQLSVAHISMLAAAAGLVRGDWSTDYDGVDMTIKSSARYPGLSGTELDVQLKCTSQVDLLTDEHLAWSLHRLGYEKLQDPERFSLGILAVLVVPESYDDWLDQDEERLLANSRMYYSVATDWDPIAEGAASKTVHCPRANVLDVDSLLGLMSLSADFRRARLS